MLFSLEKIWCFLLDYAEQKKRYKSDFSLSVFIIDCYLIPYTCNMLCYVHMEQSRNKIIRISQAIANVFVWKLAEHHNHTNVS